MLWSLVAELMSYMILSYQTIKLWNADSFPTRSLISSPMLFQFSPFKFDICASLFILFMCIALSSFFYYILLFLIHCSEIQQVLLILIHDYLWGKYVIIRRGDKKIHQLMRNMKRFQGTKICERMKALLLCTRYSAKR